LGIGDRFASKQVLSVLLGTVHSLLLSPLSPNVSNDEPHGIVVAMLPS
jgi:hypothetical protein